MQTTHPQRFVQNAHTENTTLPANNADNARQICRVIDFFPNTVLGIVQLN